MSKRTKMAGGAYRERESDGSLVPEAGRGAKDELPHSKSAPSSPVARAPQRPAVARPASAPTSPAANSPQRPAVARPASAPTSPAANSPQRPPPAPANPAPSAAAPANPFGPSLDAILGAGNVGARQGSPKRVHVHAQVIRRVAPKPHELRLDKIVAETVVKNTRVAQYESVQCCIDRDLWTQFASHQHAVDAATWRFKDQPRVHAVTAPTDEHDPYWTIVFHNPDAEERGAAAACLNGI